MDRITACAIALAALTPACASEASDGNVPGECPVSCDDGDFCTEDRCGEDGECFHVPRDAGDACRMDSHCDDSDPCTTDTCAFDSECPELQRCRHDTITNCRSCLAFQSCDDGNACTTDTCDSDFLCHYELEPTCDRRCAMYSTPNFYTPSTLLTGEANVYGRATPSGGLGCVGTCECSKSLVLTDFGAEVSLTGLETDWSCVISGLCAEGASAACAPLEADREYVVYGEALATTPKAQEFVPRDPAAPPPQDATGMPDTSVNPGDRSTILRVEGWCMAPTDLGVQGTYDGSVIMDGEVDPITFVAELRYDNNWGGPIVEFRNGGTRLADQQTYRSMTFAQAQFYLVVDGRQVQASLFPAADRLAGPLIDMDTTGGIDGDAGARPDVPEPPGPTFGKRIGTMTLVLRPKS